LLRADCEGDVIYTSTQAQGTYLPTPSYPHFILFTSINNIITVTLRWLEPCKIRAGAVMINLQFGGELFTCFHGVHSPFPASISSICGVSEPPVSLFSLSSLSLINLAVSSILTSKSAIEIF